jgi:hypothetical protein
MRTMNKRPDSNETIMHIGGTDMRRTIGLLTLLALAVFGAACTTAENSNSNANSNARVLASPSPSVSPANSNANARDNMNAGDMSNMNMGNHNKKANAKKTP